MAIKVSCACGKTISAKDEFAGRRVKCPACKKPLRIPEANVEEESYEDEWDLDDYGEDEADSLPVRSRRTNKIDKSKSWKSGRKSKPNLLIGLSAGGGLLLVVAFVWLLLPSRPDGDVANHSAVAAIEDLGGEVTFDETVPGKPAIGVTLGWSKPVTDASLEHFKELTSLRRLSFRGPVVTDTELLHLKGIKNLQHLSLYETKVTDAGLVHLKGMKNLQTLDLKNNSMTDASLEHLEHF